MPDLLDLLLLGFSNYCFGTLCEKKMLLLLLVLFQVIAFANGTTIS